MNDQDFSIASPCVIQPMTPDELFMGELHKEIDKVLEGKHTAVVRLHKASKRLIVKFETSRDALDDGIIKKYQTVEFYLPKGTKFII